MKAQFKHTPGPWKVRDFDKGLQIYGRVGDDSVKISEIVMPYRGIEDLEKNKIERSREGLSNAKLIAAAPDMLKELIEAMEELKSLRTVFTEGLPVHETLSLRAWKMEEVIKKATDS